MESLIYCRYLIVISWIHSSLIAMVSMGTDEILLLKQILHVIPAILYGIQMSSVAWPDSHLKFLLQKKGLCVPRGMAGYAILKKV